MKDKNYAKYVTLKKHDEDEKEIFSDMQIKRLHEAADAVVGIAGLIMIMIYTGWRIQEFCNLTRFDFDEEANTLAGGLKTTAGKNRTVPVPDKVMPYLMHHVEHGQESLFCYKNQKRLRSSGRGSTRRLTPSIYDLR